MLAATGKLSIDMKVINFCIILIVFTIGANGQTVECPQGYICLNQTQANIAAQNAREIQVQKEKVSVLESALKSKDESIAELKKTNDQNVADLREALKRTEIALAEKTGQLIARESEVVRQSKIIEAMIPMLRKKRIALITIF